MTRARDPTEDKNKKEKAYILWLEAGGEKAPTGTLSKIAKALGVDSGTVRGWKSKEKWNGKCNVAKSEGALTCNVADKKKANNSKTTKILEASEMYLQGTSVSKISEKTGVSELTLRKWRRRYKWVESREKLVVRVTEKLYQKHKKQRFKEREATYKMLSIIRAMAMQKLTATEVYIEEDTGEKVAYKKIGGNVLASELNALSTAVKIIEETNKLQDKMLGISDVTDVMNRIADSSKLEGQDELETKKFLLTTEMKMLELLNKDGNGAETEEGKETEKELEAWAMEVWEE